MVPEWAWEARARSSAACRLVRRSLEASGSLKIRNSRNSSGGSRAKIYGSEADTTFRIDEKNKAIRRTAYGFRDDAYSFLKIRAAFP